MAKKKIETKQIVNRKAKFEYQFLSEFEAGLVLVGTEVKAIKEGNANLSDAYCLFQDGNLTLKSMYVGEYKYGTINNHETRRDRRLLLRKSELKKIERRVVEKGMTLVPYKLYFSERGHIKLQIWLAQGKKSYDKRQSIKERENKRDLDRIKKEY
ncbi:MAG: SsrA-binding protein SmpB [Saprospiraceae bacterium]